jgi:hypothetical protein
MAELHGPGIHRRRAGDRPRILTLCASFSSFQFKAASVVIAAIFASGIASVLVMVRLLDFPFEGPLALNAADFSNTLVKVTNLLSGGVPQVQ